MIKTLQVESHRVQKVQLIPLRGEDEMDFEVSVKAKRQPRCRF